MMKRNGFTLVEVLITLTILSLVLVLSFQSLSVFLNAASNSKSELSRTQNEVYTRLMLRSSIAGMLDYYVRNQAGLNRPFFYADNQTIQYVSSSPMVFKQSQEVLASLQIKTIDEQLGLEVTECPLKSVLFYTQPEQPLARHQACRTVSFVAFDGQIEFFTVEPAGKSSTPQFNIPGFELEKQLTAHLLPEEIQVRFVKEGKEHIWTFFSRVENIRKFYQNDGGHISA
ncbi:prepilin-type N-terminal cleavage/methylation domain-containing protein [Pseudoalteromonas sp. YIC-656]|uniref:PulJ/GspJ family protein n=1 Tax=Pseudoalteromonas pernae TaxID=3118054 RepID=UPI003242EBCA